MKNMAILYFPVYNLETVSTTLNSSANFNTLKTFITNPYDNGTLDKLIIMHQFYSTKFRSFSPPQNAT